MNKNKHDHFKHKHTEDDGKNKSHQNHEKHEDHKEHSSNQGHHDHHSHMVEDFKKRFWISLVVTIPSCGWSCTFK